MLRACSVASAAAVAAAAAAAAVEVEAGVKATCTRTEVSSQYPFITLRGRTSSAQRLQEHLQQLLLLLLLLQLLLLLLLLLQLDLSGAAEGFPRRSHGALRMALLRSPR